MLQCCSRKRNRLIIWARSVPRAVTGHAETSCCRLVPCAQPVLEVAVSTTARSVSTSISPTSARRGRTWCLRTAPAAADCRPTRCSAVDISTTRSPTSVSTAWISSATCQSRPDFRHFLKARFHYAILVADRSEAGRRPVADLLARASSLLVSDRPNSSSLQVCEQPWTCLRPG